MYLPNTTDLAVAIHTARQEELRRTVAAGRRQQRTLRTTLGTGLVRLGERLLVSNPRARPSAQ